MQGDVAFQVSSMNYAYVESDLITSKAELDNSEEGFLDGLNPEQKQGAVHTEGPILILAGAGSGKTRVLTHRIAHLVNHYRVKSDRILAVTFTNKATREMKERLHRLLGDSARQLWVGTFHSIGLRILRRTSKTIGYQNDFAVYDTQDVKSLMKQILKELKVDEKKYPASHFLKIIDRAKNNGISAAEYDPPNGYAGLLAAEVFQRYQESLVRSQAMDFGDLLLNLHEVFRRDKEILRFYQRQFEFVLVDEFQDTNKVQYDLIQMLAKPQNNLFVVGDDDQSIYAFRGATIENILHFEQDYPEAKVVKLEQNYRSTKAILEAANSVIARNKSRKGKNLWTELESEELISGYVADNESEEASFVCEQIQRAHVLGVPFKHMAIFYRTNAQSRAIEDALVSEQIPYRIFGGLKFYDRKEIKDILAYLKLLLNPHDSQAFLRCINTPPRGIGNQTVRKIFACAEDFNHDLLCAAREVGATTASVGKFVDLMQAFQDKLQSEPLYELIGFVIEASGYAARLRNGKDITSQSRLENLKELQVISGVYSNRNDSPLEDLKEFLDKVSLSSSEDSVEDADKAAQEESGEYVSLMTLHLAKGLEFPLVFLVGVEEGLLPHYRSLDDPFSLEEERRLFYVGMTRAMRKLYMTRAVQRGLFSAGASFGFGASFRKASRYLADVPAKCIEDEGQALIDDSDDEDIFEESSWRSSIDHRKKEMVKKNGVSFVQSADALIQQHPEINSLPMAKDDELFIGQRVLHPTFGYGEVIDLEGEGPKCKLRVKFENFDLPKKLVFKHAGLRVG